MLNRAAVLFALTFTLAAAAPAAHATGEPLIEVGVSVGGSVVDPWDASSDVVVAGGFTSTASAQFHFLFIDASADATYVGLPGVGQSAFEVRADGGLFFLKLQEYYYRTGTGANAALNGEMQRVMAGLGGKVNLPKTLGAITANAGVLAMNWQRPGGSEQEALGLYAGGKIALRIWKFEDELRVAYFWIPEINSDLDSLLAGKAAIQGWQTGMIASNTLRFDAFKVAGFKLGPELRAQLEDIPDGLSWTATLGVSGRFGL
jgi:hypothetical protein